ncbi:MAG: thioredoxin domain-containing protein, partial [Armatimonadaceae bacterium]
PSYGGTYFPPTRRHGRTGFLELVGQLAEAWNTRRDEVESVADTLAADLQESTRQRPIPGPPGPPDPEQLRHDAVTSLEERFDAEYGGFGGAPKFPPHHGLRLLCSAIDHGDPRAVPLLTITLDRMAQGGLYDHVGGGFHRYCTDRVWLLPHFEKMLYDNALLARVYADAGALLDNPAWKRIARETCDWVLDAMREPEGGFVAAFDADSEGEEGRYYVWSRAEAEALAGTAWCERYCIETAGNYHDEATGLLTGNSIPHLGLGPEAPRLPAELTPAEITGRHALRVARKRRVPPLRDHKVLANWNGLMIGALARCGAVLGETRYLDAAREAARFCLGPLSPDGLLMHRWAEGEAAIPAFLDDMAYVADGLLDLADATGEPQWRAAAARLADGMRDDFSDDEDGGFFFASERRHERLVARSKDLFDGALPSANGVAL